MIFPHTLQVDRAHFALYRRWRISVDERMVGSHGIQDLLRAYYAEHGIEPLDLLPAFRAADRPLYWEEDEHLNGAGQALAAEASRSSAFHARLTEARTRADALRRRVSALPPAVPLQNALESAEVRSVQERLQQL